MNLRRNLLIVLGAASLTPRAVFAQGKKPPVVIGWLSWGSRAVAESSRETFRNELASLGWRAGEHVLIEERLADGNTERLTVLAEELARKKPALTRGWPVLGGANWADDGALVSYAAALMPLYRRAAYLVDRILKGAKPADLPIERAMTFELVLNMKTAKALGLTIPHEFGVRVDRVIQ